MSAEQRRACDDTPGYLERLHEAQRGFPRIEVRRPVRARRRDGTRAAVRLEDVTPDSVRILCDRENAARLHPSGRYVKPDDAPEVFLELPLAGEAGDAEVVVRCRMLYLSLRDREVAFGLAFDAESESVDRALDQYLAHCMEPCEPEPPRDEEEDEYAWIVSTMPA